MKHRAGLGLSLVVSYLLLVEGIGKNGQGQTV